MSFVPALATALGSALGAFAQDGVLHATTLTDTGAGGVLVETVDLPVKVTVESIATQDRIGLPRDAVRLIVLTTGLDRTVALDDGLSVAGTNYRVIGVEADPIGASLTATAVPA